MLENGRLEAFGQRPARSQIKRRGLALGGGGEVFGHGGAQRRDEPGERIGGTVGRAARLVLQRVGEADCRQRRGARFVHGGGGWRVDEFFELLAQHVAREAQLARALVEHVADGNVDRVGQDRVVGGRGGAHEHGVAAAHEQREKRVLGDISGRGAAGWGRQRLEKPRREQMAYHMVHANQRHVERHTESLGKVVPSRERSDHAGATGCADEINF